MQLHSYHLPAQNTIHLNKKSDDVYFTDDLNYDHNDYPPLAATIAASDPNSGGIKFDEGPPFIEGDACTDSERRWHGFCTMASQCPTVLQAFKRKGDKPTICSYKAVELIVCCPVNPSAAADNLPVETSVTPSPERVISSTSRFDAAPPYNIGTNSNVPRSDGNGQHRRPALVASLLPQFSQTPPRPANDRRSNSGDRLSQQSKRLWFLLPVLFI